jgi:hypothetical protein
MQKQYRDIYNAKSIKALPLTVAASSRNPINWDPKLTNSFIKGCKKYDKKEI